MRLFYALELDRDTKDSLALLQQDLMTYCPNGVFTRSNNLHLTLCFLGDVEGHSLTILKEILHSLEANSLQVKFDQLGLFHKRQGDILWVGVEENRELLALQKELAYVLRANNFLLDDQTFTPHVTLSRGGRCKKLPSIEELVVPCNTISLMHSHQKHTILTYTPLFTHQLGQTATL